VARRLVIDADLAEADEAAKPVLPAAIFAARRVLRTDAVVTADLQQAMKRVGAVQYADLTEADEVPRPVPERADLRGADEALGGVVLEQRDLRDAAHRPGGVEHQPQLRQSEEVTLRHALLQAELKEPVEIAGARLPAGELEATGELLGV